MKSDHWIARVIQGITGTAVASILMVVGGFVLLFVFSLMLKQCGLTVSTAAELYIWTDGNGKKHITDTPPTAAKETNRKITYTPDDPREIEKWEKQQKETFQARERIRQQNEAREEAKRSAQQSPLSASERKQKDLWAEYNKASKEYHKAKYEGDKTPPYKDPKWKAMFDTMKKAVNYQLSK